MKDDTVQTLKNATKNLIDVTDRFGITNISQFINTNNSNNNMYKNDYEESENNEKDYKESNQQEDKSYSDNISDDYNLNNTTSNSQGVIESITNELTSVKLQQAIILSEIVAKPRSKTRRKRRF